MSGKATFIGLVLIFSLALGVRLIGLGSFMTADEANWMIRSGDFWHALFLRHDPGGTFQTSHPGVITMWVAGAGIVLQEARLGYHIDDDNLAHFRVASTLPIALATAALIALTVWNLQRLWPKDNWLPYVAGFLLAVDPYLTGMSQIIHLDALLCLLMLNALIFALRYVAVPYHERSIKLLTFTGLFCGLALLNKFFEAVWLAPILIAIFLVQIPGSWRQRLRAALPKLLFLLGVAVLTMFILWPALWEMKNTTEYFARDAVTITTVDTTDISASDDPTQGSAFYLRIWLGRLSLFTMIAGLAALGLLLREAIKTKKIHPVLWLGIYSVTYLLFISLVAKKADRYALPALVVWPILAAWGLAVAVRSMQDVTTHTKKVWVYGAVALVLVAMLTETLLWSPYAIAYNNEIFAVRPLSGQGWGEGLDAAARWLNTQKFDIPLSVATWYPTVFGTYFQGKTYSLSSRQDPRVGMVVLYRNMQGRGSDDQATNIWDEYKNQIPVKIISIAGQPYVWIYETLTIRYFPKMIGELTGGVEVGQTVPVTQNNWSRIDIGMSNFSGRQNTHDVILHVKDNPNTTIDIRTVVKPAAEVVDSDWNTFTFAPIPDSGGKTYYVSLTSPDSIPGNAITVKFSKQVIKPGIMYLRREPLAAGKQMSSFTYAGTLAYRLP